LQASQISHGLYTWRYEQQNYTFYSGSRKRVPLYSPLTLPNANRFSQNSFTVRLSNKLVANVVKNSTPSSGKGES